MDTGLHPLLLNDEVCDADVSRPGRLEHQVAVVEKVLKGGGGEVAPRMRRVSVHPIRSTLVLLMPALWRARLIRDVMFSVSFGLSLKPVNFVLSSSKNTIHQKAEGFYRHSASCKK